MQATVLVTCFCALSVDTVLSAEKSGEEVLLKYLFDGYNPSARPVLNSSLTVAVNLRFSLLQIQELNVRSQVLTTTGLLILDWMDERLRWNESISELEELVVHSANIWRPEFAVINGAESIYVEYNEFQAVVRRDGRVRWEPGGVFRTMCPIDIMFYPFDEQTCKLIFGAWSYYTTKMNLTVDEPDTFGLTDYETNSEWEIIGTEVQRNEFHFECCPTELFSNIAFSVELRRRHEFYVMNIVLPGVLTSAILLSIFYCIPSQKVHIGVAALLSFRLFLVKVADTVPRTSDHVPLLGVYLTCTMTITTMAMVATVFVGNLYETKDRPVPSWVRTILLHYAAPLLGYCSRCMDSPLPLSATQVSDVTGLLPSQDGDGERPCRRATFPENTGCRQRVISGGEEATEPQASVHLLARSAAAVSRAPAMAATRRSVPRPLRSYSKDWANVGAVCDRLFFWLCLCLTIITTAVLFQPLMPR